jgi:hypothetical protein
VAGEDGEKLKQNSSPVFGSELNQSRQGVGGSAVKNVGNQEKQRHEDY